MSFPLKRPTMGAELRHFSVSFNSSGVSSDILEFVFAHLLDVLPK